MDWCSLAYKAEGLTGRNWQRSPGPLMINNIYFKYKNSDLLTEKVVYYRQSILVESTIQTELHLIFVNLLTPALDISQAFAVYPVSSVGLGSKTIILRKTHISFTTKAQMIQFKNRP